MDKELFRVRCGDRSGEHEYSIQLIHEFGTPVPTAGEVRDMWAEASQHDVLFTDDTQGQLEPFVLMMLDPRSLWIRVVRVADNRIVGVLMLTDVIIGADAEAHFRFWDSIGRGREPIVWEAMRWAFERYQLRRLSTQIPPYQMGTIRFTKRLGFREEGERRGAIVHKGTVMPLKMYGILKSEFEEAWNERHTPRK